MLNAKSVTSTIIAAWATIVLAQSDVAQAKTPVSIELVLAVDTSYSVNKFEYDLLMTGIAKAFRTPEIIDLIGLHDGVAVTLFQWSAGIEQESMVPWHLLNDPLSVLLFADRIENLKREPNSLYTGIGEAINFGVGLITENAFEGSQLTIDVSGDGTNNYYPGPSIPRQAANDLGIVINGLPIISPDNSSYDLESYYREEVIVGPGAFIEVADDYDFFSRAFLRKLRRELSAYVSDDNTAPPSSVQQARTHSEAGTSP